MWKIVKMIKRLFGIKEPPKPLIHIEPNGQGGARVTRFVDSNAPTRRPPKPPPIPKNGGRRGK